MANQLQKLKVLELSIVDEGANDMEFIYKRADSKHIFTNGGVFMSKNGMALQSVMLPENLDLKDGKTYTFTKSTESGHLVLKDAEENKNEQAQAEDEKPDEGGNEQAVIDKETVDSLAATINDAQAVLESDDVTDEQKVKAQDCLNDANLILENIGAE